MNLTTRQLEVFVGVAERSSFAHAAFKLGISQSAVSNHIAALEKELGCALFIRRRGGSPTLSLEGSRFAIDANAFLAAARALSSQGTAHSPTRIHVHVGSHILERFIKPALADFYAANPDISLRFSERPVGNVIAGLRKRLFDCAMVVLPSAPTEPDSELLSPLHSGLYGAVGDQRPPGDRSHSRFILPPEGSTETAILTRHLLAAGFDPIDVAFHTQYPPVMVQMAASGAGFAPLLDSMALHHDRAGSLRKIIDLPDWFLCLAISPRLPAETSRRLRDFFRSVSSPAVPPAHRGPPSPEIKRPA